MSLFAGTAGHYGRHRSGIPHEAVRLLVEGTAPATRRLLDLGTGTGIVVAALRTYFDDVIAVEPEQTMLEQARRTVGEEVTWVHARAEEFTPPADWMPDLVTICRAFHWMDQEVVLERIDAYAGPHTTIAIMGDGSVWTSAQPWKVATREVIQEFLGKERRAGDGIFRGDHRPFPEILAESAFPRVDEHRIEVRRERDVESVIGYLRSTSFAAEHLFGDRVEAFRSRVREALAPYVVGGVIDDHNEFRILLARRE